MIHLAALLTAHVLRVADAQTCPPCQACVCNPQSTQRVYHCDPDSQALGLTPGQFEGESIRFLSWTTARRFPAVTASAANLFNCTGLTVHVEDLSTGLRGEMSNDLGLGTSSDGPGIYDAYITKSSWTAEMADEGLVEPLNSHIVRTPGLAWGNVLQSAKKMTTFQQNGSSSVMMMPLDGDYWTILMRKVRVAIGSVLSTPSAACDAALRTTPAVHMLHPPQSARVAVRGAAGSLHSARHVDPRDDRGARHRCRVLPRH